ncbi:helix-turn-helix domain-containing protein [Streptomyces xanthophaeus]|uniref:helix-turn-helix domain-containing protein n=1 Tax=Streptomyces xanthophaeus TaxID=67385 RepID=UPI00370FF906
MSAHPETVAPPGAAPPGADLQEALSRWLAPVRARFREDDPYGPSLTLHQLGSLRLITCAGGPLRLSRTPGLVARGAGDAVVLVLPRRGAARLVQDGRGATVAAGELALIDLGRAFALEQEAGARILLARMSAHALGLAPGALRPLTGRAVPTSGGTAALLAALLPEVDDAGACCPGAMGEALGGIVTDLVAGLADELTDAGDEACGTGRGHLVTGIRRYIDANLADPGLAPEHIAAAHRISVRYLHRLFEAEEATVGRLIRQRRVEQCRSELLRRARADPAIAAVALRWGFRSPSHFSRAFKALHGRPPRQWRAEVRSAADSGGAAGRADSAGPVA